jgi:hypothetical protein
MGSEQKKLVSSFDIFPCKIRRYSTHTIYLFQDNKLDMVNEVFFMAGTGMEDFIRSRGHNSRIHIKQVMGSGNRRIGSRYLNAFANFCKKHADHIEEYSETLTTEECSCYWRVLYTILSDTEYVKKRGPHKDILVFEL